MSFLHDDQATKKCLSVVLLVEFLVYHMCVLCATRTWSDECNFSRSYRSCSIPYNAMFYCFLTVDDGDLGGEFRSAFGDYKQNQ